MECFQSAKNAEACVRGPKGERRACAAADLAWSYFVPRFSLRRALRSLRRLRNCDRETKARSSQFKQRTGKLKKSNRDKSDARKRRCEVRKFDKPQTRQ